MKIFMVGGAVRDTLLVLEPKDRDYVVVGATVQEMEQLGFKQVGKDFPVFLHPETNEEYALARTEKKTGPKHTDFTTEFGPSVTLEEDLYRRDLTINAMALETSGDEHILIDPYNGLNDLMTNVLRHVSENFKDDPLRVLRLARFKARYSDFTIAPETFEMIKDMVSNGELEHLSHDRVWLETKKALLSDNPFEYFKVLSDIDALKYVSGKDVFFTMPSRETFNKLVSMTSSMDDETKLLLRATFLYKNVYDVDSVSSSIVEKHLNSIKVPSDIIDYVKFIQFKSSDVFELLHHKKTPKQLVKILDKINIKPMLQKNDLFIEHFFIIHHAMIDISHKDSNLIRELIFAYLDTKEELKKKTEYYISKHQMGPTKHDFMDMIGKIRENNISKVLEKYE